MKFDLNRCIKKDNGIALLHMPRGGKPMRVRLEHRDLVLENMFHGQGLDDEGYVVIPSMPIPLNRLENLCANPPAAPSAIILVMPAVDLYYTVAQRVKYAKWQFAYRSDDHAVSQHVVGMQEGESRVINERIGYVDGPHLIIKVSISSLDAAMDAGLPNADDVAA